MHDLVRTVFSRLHYLDPVAEEAKLASYDEEAQDAEIKIVAKQVEASESPEVTEDTEQAPLLQQDKPPVEDEEPAPMVSNPTGPRPECKHPTFISRF